MQTILILLIKSYRLLVSPVLVSLFGHACRYSPTCSEYSLEAIESHGALKGIQLALKRIGKCHPFGGSGYDPVPEKHLI